MIWWVYKHAKESEKLDDVFVATDSKEILDYCESADIKCVMTREHENHISRLYEVSTLIKADIYVCINGDEPLLEANIIDSAIEDNMDIDKPCFYGAIRKLTDPAETIDPGNIKIITRHDKRCLYISRSPIPFPRGTLSFDYKKYIGIECFNKITLEIFVNLKEGLIEQIEDIDHIRFLENDIPMYFNEINSDSISVDTQKDLEKVRSIIKKRLNQ